jgi:hypothetical protein
MKILAFILALCGFGAISAKDCPYSGQSWIQDTGYFLDCINQEIDHDVNIIDTKQRDREQELIAIFNRHSSCGSYFQKPKTHDFSNNFQDFFQNGDLTKILQDSRNNFFATSAGSTNLIADAVDFLRKIIWTIAESETMSSCLINNFRDKFLKFMDTCLGTKTGDGGFQMGKPLDLLPVTPRNKIQYMQRYVEDHIKAYIVIRSCSLTDRQGVIDELKAKSDEDVCHCAKANFVACPQSYNDVCPLVGQCIQDLISDPKPMLDDNGESGSMPRVVFNCFREAKDKNDLPFLQKTGQSSLEFLKDMRETGQKLMDTFNQMNPDQKKQFGEFVKQIAEAHFKADFCKKCRL